jgi:Arc/MetJ family transcription regulator
MRSTIDINEELLKEAMKLTSAKTKKELINQSLEEIIRRRRIEDLAGKLGHFDLKLTKKQLEKLRNNE